MELSLRAAVIGGLVAACSLVCAGPGFAQTGAGGSGASPSAAPAPAAPAASASAAPAAGGPPDAAAASAAKADPDCQVSSVSCAWSHCYPLSDKWHSYSACIADSCHEKTQACVMELIQDLYDPDREASNGQR